jgi:hypothetical protein
MSVFPPLNRLEFKNRRKQSAVAFETYSAARPVPMPDRFSEALQVAKPSD